MSYLIIIIISAILIQLAFNRGRRYGIQEGKVKEIIKKSNK